MNLISYPMARARRARRYPAVALASFFASLALGCGATAESAGQTTRPARDARQSFAVVELFTSEGCSSCPPADALLATLSDEARKQGLPVYTLSFHVDYWNSLGWRDPFSSPRASRRQQSYADASAGGEVYTPEMVVNGTKGFVGSDEREARRRLRAALGQPGVADVTLKVEKGSGGKVSVAYAVKGAPHDTVLNLAIVERGLTSEVARGENAGKTLRHENVVRSFDTAPLTGDAAGRIEMKLPDSVNPARASVIGFVQGEKDLAILGAAAVELPS